MTVHRLNGWNRFTDKQTASPWAEGGERNKNEETPIPPAVEDITGDEDEGILEPEFECVVYVRVADCPVNKEYKGQKERKFDRVK